MLDTHIDTQTASPTAAVCESLALYGGSPERGEFDSRDVWDHDDALDALSEAIRVIVDGVTVEGTQMADEREPLLWGFVNTLHSQVARLDRAVDRIVPEMRDLERAQDGTEVKAVGARDPDRPGAQPRRPPRRVREDARHRRRRLPGPHRRRLAPAPRIARQPHRPAHLGRHRRPRLPARPPGPRDPNAHLPDGTLVAVTGGKQVADGDAVWTTLDRTREKHGDMVLLHGGGPGYREDRRELGGRARGRPGDLPPGLERPRQGRPVQAERRAAEPAAEGRHRVPRLGHHRQPRRQGPPARHPGLQHVAA